MPYVKTKRLPASSQATAILVRFRPPDPIAALRDTLAQAETGPDLTPQLRNHAAVASIASVKLTGGSHPKA